MIAIILNEETIKEIASGLTEEKALEFLAIVSLIPMSEGPWVWIPSYSVAVRYDVIVKNYAIGDIKDHHLNITRISNN